MSKNNINDVCPIIQIGYDKTAEDVMNNANDILSLIDELEEAEIDYAKLPRLCGYIIAELCDVVENLDDIVNQIMD